MSAGIAEAESRAASPCLKTGTLRPGPVLHDLSKNPRTLKPDEAAPISPHEKGHASQKQKEKRPTHSQSKWASRRLRSISRFKARMSIRQRILRFNLTGQPYPSSMTWNSAKSRGHILQNRHPQSG
jgi:hypothetical protein